MLNNYSKKLIKNFLLKKNILSKILLFFYKRNFANGYFRKKNSMINAWAWGDNELSNFYYDLTDLNKEYLADLISLVTGRSTKEVSEYFSELLNDQDLYRHLNSSLKNIPEYGKEIKFAYGRRIGWYAFARILKPKLIIETGVDHGVGSCVLTSALLKNKLEGFQGTYLGTDNNIQAGKLLVEPYSSVGKILYGDSVASLMEIKDPIDIFINDSDHSSEYEFQEYLTIEDKISTNSIILGDNSHYTNSLSKFSKRTNRNFLFFKESPEEHWYPGAGIGISFAK